MRLVGRSFKLHRPRGVWSCGAEEPSALVDIGRAAPGARPMCARRSCRWSEGLVARSVNCWPSVGFDFGALTGMLGGLLPAGFYYKTFMWPNWQVFEPAIRRMAGLGRGPAARDADHYEEISATADVLVVGGGLAGLAAAAAAAARGGEHAADDEWRAASAARSAGSADPEVAALGRSARQLGVQMQLRTIAFGIYDHNLVCACESVECEGAADLRRCVLRERLWKIRARTVIAATGRLRAAALFPDNDRPGVMLAGAALKLRRGPTAVACGRRAVHRRRERPRLRAGRSLCAMRAWRLSPSSTAARREAGVAAADCVSSGARR